MERKSLALKLLDLRQSRNLTQKQLCKMLHIGRSTYSYFETGSRVPDIETLLIIAQFYHVSLDYLLDVPNPNTGRTKKAPPDETDTLISHHLKSKHIPIDFILELSKADFDFLRDYKNLSHENQAELQYLMNYKLRKQKS